MVLRKKEEFMFAKSGELVAEIFEVTRVDYYTERKVNPFGFVGGPPEITGETSKVSFDLVDSSSSRYYADISGCVSGIFSGDFIKVYYAARDSSEEGPDKGKISQIEKLDKSHMVIGNFHNLDGLLEKR